MARRMRWSMYLWPGLPQLCLHGSWSALGVALGAAAVLNLALVVSFVWSELVDADVRSAVWIALGAAWVTAAVLSVASSRRRASGGQADSAEDAFGEALEHYLKGDWFQAERVLGKLLADDPRDADARLMLATLFRHTDRLDEATRQFDLLSRLEGAEKWEWEIRRERELLAETRPATDGLVEQPATDDSGDPATEMTRAA